MLDKFQIHKVKEVAKLLDRDIQKREKLYQKIQELGMEYDSVCSNIEKWDALVKDMTGGYGVDDLVIKVKNPGKPAVFSLKYPDTVLPPEMADAVPVDSINDEPLDEIEINHEDIAANENNAATFVNKLI